MTVSTEFPQTALAAERGGPRLPPVWTSDRVTLALIAALVPSLAAVIYATGADVLPLLAASVVVSAGCTLLFALPRGRDMNWHCIPAAIVFALMVPPGVPLWQALASLAFGVVVGEQVFGGRGYAFLHPAVAGLAFLFFSFPGSVTAAPLDMPFVAIAAAAGGVLLLAGGILSWRVLIGVAAGLAAALAIDGWSVTPQALFTASLALGIVFLVADPVAAASTNIGRWVYGLLAGMLIGVLGAAGEGPGSTQAVVFAAMLGSVFAPLIDSLVVLFNVRRRRRRGG